jgi:hypothetical protein
MKTFSNHVGKTVTAISVVVGIAASVIACWQFFKSATKHNLAGEWKLKFKVESSTYKPYVGETHTQKVFFHQNDCEITGQGEKCEYNGAPLPFNMHRKLEYIGQVDDNNFKANYTLHGLKRETPGIIDMEISDGGRRMSGRFSGTAGNASGTVEGEKIN